MCHRLMTAKKVELLAREIQEVSREQTQFFPFKHAHSMRDVLRNRRERDREGKKKSLVHNGISSRNFESRNFLLSIESSNT